MFDFLRKIRRWRRKQSRVSRYTVIPYDEEQSSSIRELRDELRAIKFSILRLLEFPECYRRIYDKLTHTINMDTVEYIEQIMIHASIERSMTTRSVPTEQSLNGFRKWLHEIDRLQNNAFSATSSSTVVLDLITPYVHRRTEEELRHEIELFKHRFVLLLKFPRIFAKQQRMDERQMRVKNKHYLQSAFYIMKSMYESFARHFVKEYPELTKEEERVWSHRDATMYMKMKALSDVLPLVCTHITDAYAKRFEYYFSDRLCALKNTELVNTPHTKVWYILAEYSLVEL